MPEDHDRKVLQQRKESPVYLESIDEKEAVLLQETETTTIEKVCVASETDSSRVVVKEKKPSTSYGGTFHVSKQVAPLPSPSICRNKT